MSIQEVASFGSLKKMYQFALLGPSSKWTSEPAFRICSLEEEVEGAESCGSKRGVLGERFEPRMIRRVEF